MEANYGHEILVEIGGDSKITGTNTANKGYSLLVYGPDEKFVTVRIYSGIFDEAQPAAYIDPGSAVSEDGRTITEKKES